MKEFKVRYYNHHQGNESKILWMDPSDHSDINVGKRGLNYVRRWKNHITIYLTDMMNDNSIIEGFEDKVKSYINYLNKLGVRYELKESIYKSYMNKVALFKINIEDVKILK
jgi:hypothetical protein